MPPSGAAIVPVALFVSMDEPCMGLYELNQMAPDSKSIRRYQIIRVLRGDRIAEYRKDLGSRTSFIAPEFRVPGGVIDTRTKRISIMHTVGELIDIANFQREGIIRQPDKPKPTDLVKGYHDHMDQKAKLRRKASSFGALHKVQRGS